MLYRKIIHELELWANETVRKPLILRGARQVGKTTAVDIFSKQFSDYMNMIVQVEEELLKSYIKSIERLEPSNKN